MQDELDIQRVRFSAILMARLVEGDLMTDFSLYLTRRLKTTRYSAAPKTDAAS